MNPPSFAALDGHDIQYDEFFHRAQQSKRSPSMFSDVSTLLAALAVGRRFDLLVLPLQPEAAQMEQLIAVCKVLRMPMLVVTLPGHVDMNCAMAELLLNGFLIDIASADVVSIEIDWRIDALLRRAQAHAREPHKPRELVLGDYTFLEQQQTVLHRGRRIILPPRQFELAQTLFLNIGKVLTRDWLLSSLWGMTSQQEGTRSLDVCITNIRKKLDLRSGNEFKIRSIYRHGYMLCSAQESMPVQTGGRLDMGDSLREPPTGLRSET